MTAPAILLFDSPKPFLDAFDAMHIRNFGPYNHDAHVNVYYDWKRAYGSWEGYYLALASKAISHAHLMQTEKGRAFLDRVAKSHREYQR